MSREELLQRVSTDRNICGGMACIKGTRIAVAIIIDSLAGGRTEKEILDSYPTLKADDIRAALAYAGEMVKENIWRTAG
jgi:uncharacterized protein (DUF433 family)